MPNAEKLCPSEVGIKGEPCYEVNPGEKAETTTVVATFNAVGMLLSCSS